MYLPSRGGKTFLNSSMVLLGLYLWLVFYYFLWCVMEVGWWNRTQKGRKGLQGSKKESCRALVNECTVRTNFPALQHVAVRFRFKATIVLLVSLVANKKYLLISDSMWRAISQVRGMGGTQLTHSPLFFWERSSGRWFVAVFRPLLLLFLLLGYRLNRVKSFFSKQYLHIKSL